MANFLFEVEQKTRLEQNGVLKRFSVECYGKQPTMEDLRAKKTEMFRLLANKKGTREYEEWFLKYSPNKNKLHPNSKLPASLQTEQKEQEQEQEQKQKEQKQKQKKENTENNNKNKKKIKKNKTKKNPRKDRGILSPIFNF
jgi:hypothetical protein